MSDTQQTAVYPSIVIANKAGNIFVSYIQFFSLNRNGIILLIYEGSSWNKKILSNDTLGHSYPTLAIDNNDIFIKHGTAMIPL